MALKLIVQIVTWNSEKFLKDCLDSLLEQDYRNFSILIIDNGSQDKTREILKQNYSEEQIKKKWKREITRLFVFQNNKNVGFAQAHNQGLRLMDSEFVLIMNPDIILTKNFLSNLMARAEKEEGLGSFCGKLLKIKSGAEDYEKYIRTDVIDSVGLKVFRNRHFIDQGQGEEDQGQYDEEKKIFGASGACVLFQRKALEEVKIPKTGLSRPCLYQTRASAETQFSNQIKDLEKIGEYFDEDFFAYQEDMDLAWRLQLKNWSCLYVPQAVAYHFRGTGLKEKPNLKEIWQAHQQRSKKVEFYSFRNHLWLLLKNSYWSNFFRHFFHIFFYQLSKEIYLLFFKPKILFKASAGFWRKFWKMRKKRKIIMAGAKQSPHEIRTWF